MTKTRSFLLGSIFLALPGLAAAQPGQPAPAPGPAPAPAPYGQPPAGQSYGQPQQPVLTGPYASNSGFTIGFGLGVSVSTCDNDCESEEGIGFDFEIGGFVSPRLALLYDVNIFLDIEDEGSAYLMTNAVAAKYYVAPRLWLKGGLGLAQLQVNIDGFGRNISETGFGLTSGIGYEVIDSHGSFGMDIAGRMSYLIFDDFGGFGGQNFTMFGAHVGLRWR